MQAAKDFVINAADAAGVSPALTNANVEVVCLNSLYQPVACQDGVAPVNVRVGIVDYDATIGGVWFPMLLTEGGAMSFNRALAPYTVMRYMLQ